MGLCWYAEFSPQIERILDGDMGEGGLTASETKNSVDSRGALEVLCMFANADPSLIRSKLSIVVQALHDRYDILFTASRQSLQLFVIRLENTSRAI